MSDAPNLAARLEALPADVRENLDTIIGAAERDLKRRQADKDARLKQLENGANSLPVNERIAMHLLGQLAMDCYLTVNDMHEDGGANFYMLFRKISASLTDGLKVADLRELKQLIEAE